MLPSVEAKTWGRGRMDTAQRDDARFMHTWSRLQHEARRRFAGCSDCSVAMTWAMMPMCAEGRAYTA